MGGCQRLRLRNTFLELISEEDSLRTSVKWSRSSSWPCVGGDAAEQRLESIFRFDDEPQVPQSPSSPTVETGFTASTTHSSSGGCNPCIFFASSVGCRNHGEFVRFATSIRQERMVRQDVHASKLATNTRARSCIYWRKIKRTCRRSRRSFRSLPTAIGLSAHTFWPA